jgi:hypothetical protein
VSGSQVLSFVVARKPSYVGVDPYNFYIDRNSGDNVRPVPSHLESENAGPNSACWMPS